MSQRVEAFSLRAARHATPGHTYDTGGPQRRRRRGSQRHGAAAKVLSSSESALRVNAALFDAEYGSCHRCAGVRACGRDQAPCSCSGTAAREPTSRSRTGSRGHRRWRHRCAASAKFEVRRLSPHAAVMDQSFLVHVVHRYCQRTLCGAFLAFLGFCPMGE